MKKPFSVLLFLFLCVTAFAQGKISFQTDSLHLAYWPGVFPPTPISSDNLPAGLGMAADLYMGTSSSLLYLYSSTTFGPTAGPGKWPSVSVLATANPTTGAPAITGGTTVFIEVQVRSTERAAPNIFDPSQAPLFAACFFSAEFNFTLGSGITYPVMWSQTSGNWPIGTFNLDNSVYGPGARGAIPFIPEPSAAALAGLGALVALMFRRKSFHKK